MASLGAAAVRAGPSSDAVQAQPRVGDGRDGVPEPGELAGERPAGGPVAVEERLHRRLQGRPTDRGGRRRRRTPISSASPAAAAQRVGQRVAPRPRASRSTCRAVCRRARPAPASSTGTGRGRRPATRSGVHTVHRRCPQAVDSGLRLPTLPGVRRTQRRRERGSTLPFVLVCWLVAALMAFGAIAASDAFLEQQEVQSVCDGAALAAANQADEAVVYTDGVGTELPLTRATAQAAVADQLADGGTRLDAWSAETDGAEVTVRCTRYVRHRVRLAVPRRASRWSARRRRERAGADRSADGRRRPPTGEVGGRRTEAWRVKDSNLRRLSRRIYSPLPLATRATRRAVVPEKSTRTADGVPGAPGSASAAARGRSHGRRVLRRREQGRPPGGRQRPQPGGQGAVAALRLPRHQRHHRVGRRGGRHPPGRHRGAGRRRAGRLQGEADQARHLAEGARRRRAAGLRARSTRSPPGSSRASSPTTPRRSPS